MSLQSGTVAPSFSLQNQEGITIHLKDLLKTHKKVVVYFYPKALTSGCTLQACYLRDTLEEFKKLKVAIVGISPDPVKKLQTFREKEGLNFDILSDADHQTAIDYGVWGTKKLYGKEYQGIFRTTFIIEKNGKIIDVMEKVNTKTHHLELLEKLHV